MAAAAAAAALVGAAVAAWWLLEELMEALPLPEEQGEEAEGVDTVRVVAEEVATVGAQRRLVARSETQCGGAAPHCDWKVVEDRTL